MGEQLDRIATQSARKRALGDDARCDECGFTDHAALQRDGDGITCYECASAADGRATVEMHHPIGRANDPDTTMGLPGNFHRMMDAAKASWPDAVRHNMTRDPLLLIAAVLLSVRDFANVMTYYTQFAVDWLLRFQAELIGQYGHAWVSAFALPSLWEVV